MSTSPGSVISSKSHPPPPTSRPAFVDVDKIRNAYQMVAVISQRPSNGLLTFSIFREFERDGRIDRTGFIPEDMADIYLDMAKMAVARMRELRASGDLPFATRPHHQFDEHA